MGRWLRRVRGALGMGVTWAVAWSSVGFVPRWVLGINGDLPFPILFAGLGFISGVTFAGLLMLSEGRRSLDKVTLPRVAGLGALGALGLSVLFVKGTSLGWGEVLTINALFTGAGAASAAGSLAMARRAANGALPSGADADDRALEDTESARQPRDAR